MQTAFLPLVKETVSACSAFWGSRLAAFYLHGSVAYGDAVPGVSDLDTFLILEDSVGAADRQWLVETAESLQKKYGRLIEGVHLNACSIEDLKCHSFARFALKYNAKLYWGRDVVQELAASGCQTALPDADMARSRRAFAAQCLHDAMLGRQPACTGEIPSESCYAARKFARYFVIIEGAYFLMARDSFISFEKDTVLQALREHCPDFRAEIELTQRVLSDPKTAQITHTEYLNAIYPFVSWMLDQIESTG